MAETAKQYSTRLLGYVGDRDPLEILSATPGRIEALVRRRSAAELARRPEPGRWSVLEIVAHLADAEIVGAYRLRMILATPGVSIQAFDQDRFAETLDYSSAPMDQSLRVYESVRASNVRLWRTPDAARLASFGVHAERGKESVEHLRGLYAGHDLNHFMQIEKLLGVA